MAPPGKERDAQRIAKLLARAGVASRRDIERMIEERRVAINGVPVDKPATLLTSLHGVTVDGVAVNAPAPARLFRFHKPTGLLTAARDPAGRPTIYDRLPSGLPRLMPVGRLDMNTEGLLLLTTDGELKRQLELPSTGVERTYRARVFGDVSQEQLEDLIHGVEIAGVRYGAIDANLERRTGRNGWVEMKLTEGKNREVRRVLEYLGLQVSRLLRIAYGPFTLGDLQPGEVDEIRQHDLVAFKKALDGKGRMPTPSEVEGARPPQTRAQGDRPARPAPSRAAPKDARPARAEERPSRAPARGDARPDRRSAPGAPRNDRTRGPRDDRSGAPGDHGTSRVRTDRPGPDLRGGARRGTAPERPTSFDNRPRGRSSRPDARDDMKRGSASDRPNPRTREERAAPDRSGAPRRGAAPDKPGALIDRPRGRAAYGDARGEPRRAPAGDRSAPRGDRGGARRGPTSDRPTSRGDRPDRPGPRGGRPGPKGPRSPGRGAPKR